jgi:ABC-type antimicrobial peptide transport system permease subunit
MSIVARADGPMPVVAARIRAEVQQMDRRLLVGRPGPLTAMLSSGVATAGFQTMLFGLFAGIGLLLATVGVYGVMAHWVSGRTRERGVRLALGADPTALRRLVLAQAARPLALGLVTGAAAAALATRQLQASLFGITPYDPSTFAGACGVLIAAGLAAAYVPARRASRVDPLVALRTE